MPFEGESLPQEDGREHVKAGPSRSISWRFVVMGIKRERLARECNVVGTDVQYMMPKLPRQSVPAPDFPDVPPDC